VKKSITGKHKKTMKTIEEINRRIKDHSAIVLTAKELCDLVRSGESIGVDDVDVVTTATRGVMSGTLAILSFPIADPGVFSRAEQVSLNGVPAHVGPCPLFHDLIRGAEIDVVVRTPEKEILRTLSIDSIPYARMLTTRSAYRNYSAFVNPGEQAPSIFSVADFGGGCREAVFGGCGELNPLEKDHGTIGTGTRVLMNGAIGSYIGGFATSAGADVINSVAVPIPILDEEILSATSRLDSEIELPILDVQTRSALGRTDYSQVWSPDPGVTFDPARCIHCTACDVDCPTGAFDVSMGRVTDDLCCNCGHCVSVCNGGAFTAEMGAIPLHGRTIPIILRHSDRKGAIKLADELKKMIEAESFLLTEPAERLGEP
jgi:uncharacterized protein (DUF39 family)